MGNSLTYSNDLPAALAAIAVSAGDTLHIGAATAPGVALIDHLDGATNALALLGSRKWDYVVLQQGPTPPGICRDSLVLWTRLFDTRIRAAGAQTAVFMAWPFRGPLAWFDEIERSFVVAADAVHATLLPVATGWRLALTADPSLGLYGDDLHPSPAGTYLSALVIYERLTGRDARTLPRSAIVNGVTLALPDAVIQALQSAAHAANAQFPVPADGGSHPLTSAPTNGQAPDGSAIASRSTRC